MNEILKTVLRNEFTFFGTFFFIVIIGIFIATILTDIWKHRNVMKHGWPPEHCDSEGDPVLNEVEGED